MGSGPGPTPPAPDGGEDGAADPPADLRTSAESEAEGGPPPDGRVEADENVLKSDFSGVELVKASARAYRRFPGRVAVPAAIVFGAAAVADAYGFRAIDGKHLSFLTVVTVVVIGVTAFGEAFYAGLVDRLVGVTERGHEVTSVGHVLRTLPYLRLILADLLLTAAVAVASLFVVLPGLVLFTLFGLVGPLINLEDHGVMSAFVRSVSLVRRRFVTTFFVVTAPLLIEHEVVDLVGEATHDTHFLVIFLTNAVVGIIVGSWVGLFETFMAERLSSSYPLTGHPRRLARRFRDTTTS
ncbi:MAG TPA: hypothetical protein VK277_05505 [Acidimicrobiales bacterium]|nr:hypothetical protein [Acidimicrobiales bacterium]